MLHCFVVGSCLKAGGTGPAGDFLHVVLDTGAFNIMSQLLILPVTYVLAKSQKSGLFYAA